jgi:hypothetical protein
MSNAILYKLKEDESTFYNMFGDYTYLTEGYYKSLDFELRQVNVRPSLEEALDAYIVPLAMQKAQLLNVKIPQYEIITGKLCPPMLAYSINPVTVKFELISQQDEVHAKLKTLTLNGKYATICQKLPEDFRIDIVRCILGKTLVQEYNEFAATIFQAFQIPLMKIRVIVTANDYLFSAIEPLLFDDLTLKEKKIIEELGSWQR